MSSPGNGNNFLTMPHTPTKVLSPSQLSITPSMSLAHSNGSNHSAGVGPSLTQQLASIAFSSPMTNTTTSLTNHSTPQYSHGSMTPNSSINSSRFQALNTKAVTPTSNGNGNGSAVSMQPVNLFGAGSVNSMPMLNGMTVSNVNGLSGVTGVSGMASLYQQLSPRTPNAGTASPKMNANGTAQQQQQQQPYLFTTIPNLGSGSNVLSSLANAGSLSPAAMQQQGMLGQVNMNMNVNGTPTTNVNAQAHIQQSGWGLANAANGANGGGNMQIPTQNAPQFVQPTQAQFPNSTTQM